VTVIYRNMDPNVISFDIYYDKFQQLSLIEIGFVTCPFGENSFGVMIAIVTILSFFVITAGAIRCGCGYVLQMHEHAVKRIFG